MLSYPILIAFLLPCLSDGQEMSQLTGQKFSDELERMDINGIGAPNLQNYYDSLIYVKQTDTGTAIVKKMTDNLAQMFHTMTNQLKKVKDAIEQEYDDFSTTVHDIFPECCKIDGIYSPKFRTEVSETRACIHVSQSPAPNHFPNKKIEDVMKSNYQNNPNLLWQYFGGSDGTFLVFPAHRFSVNCFSYDPRLRQYYVATAANKPKDVVVAVDVSGVTATRSNYNSKTLLIVAREAVQYVIDTLNPDDRIGLVAFNDKAKKPFSCHGTQLARATTSNKKILRDFTKTWTSEGKSNYSVGIDAAFSYFDVDEAKPQRNTRESVILFLAAGENSGGDPLDVIKAKNEALNNSVTILAYSFGKGISSYWKDVLTNMSKQVKNDNSYGHKIKEGTYTHIEDDSLLHSKMASYYKDLSITNLGDEPVFSVPYVDERSAKTGLISSLCLPVDKLGGLVGVTCTDILLDELLSDITNFKQGELSYAFMIDGQGRVMVHYLQPTPNAITINPDPIDIYTLETSPEARPMIESMKRGENGNTTFKYLRTISRGILEYEGIEAREVEAEYSWRKVPGTNFSLCVVLGKNDQQSRLRQNQELLVTKEVFYYHRLDLNTKPTKKCREYERYSTIEHSMVMLSPHAFIKPYEYLYRNETHTEVASYSKYLNDETEFQANENLKLKENVKTSIQATYKAEEFWKQNHDQSQFVVWRYLGTRDGHVRVYPAVEISKTYDHFMRPWWRRTIAQKGKFVVVSPYLDNWGAGLIVTQCKAVYEGRSSGLHSADDIVDVVQCIDYPYPYFSRMFLNTYPECNSDEYRCMVIDISGFLVIYPSFSVVADKPDIEMKHLGMMERDIMQELLKEKIIERESCLDIETKKQFFSYRVLLSDLDEPVNRLLTIGYKIAPVPKSNIYIIIKRKDRLSTGTCCPFSNISPLENTCSDSDTDCCVCHKIVPYDSCQEKTTSGQSYHICSARLPDSNVRLDHELDKIKALRPCFDGQCDSRTNEQNCYKVAGCSWCVQDNAGIGYTPENQCCNIFETCPFGKVQDQKQTSCEKTKIETSEKLSSETWIGAGSGVAGGVIIIIILVIITVKCRNRAKSQNENPDYLTAVSENVVYSRSNDIQYLSEEAEKAPQMNQYSSMSNSSDGSANCPVNKSKNMET